MFVRLFSILFILAVPSFAQFSVAEQDDKPLRSVATLVKEVAPAVVNIYADVLVRTNSASPLMDDPFFRHFFGQDMFSGGAPTRVQKSLGSGVIVRADGIVITNYHVIKDAQKIKVVLSDGRELAAEIVAQERRTDLAVLKIKDPPQSLPFLRLKDVDDIEVGDPVLAIGNPFGLGQTVTRGIVSALARSQLGVSDFRSFIQTDAAINPGNSGGALVTEDGRLAGINTAIISGSGGSIGIGFAIPSNLVVPLIDSVEYGGKIVRPWIGAGVQNVTQDLAEQYGLDRPVGVIVTNVYPGSPADRAGLKEGDLILGFDGQEIRNKSAYRFRVASRKLNHEATLEVIRVKDGKVDVKVKLESPPEAKDSKPQKLSGRHPLDGATVANLSPALTSRLGINFMEKGVIVTDLDPLSTARRVGFNEGDVIRKVNAINIESIEDLAAGLKRVRGNWQSGSRISWQIELKRAGRIFTISLQ